MKIRKVLILIFLPLIAQVIFISCNCPEPLIGYYSNKDFNLYNLDNSGYEPMVTTLGSLPKEAFGLRLLLEREKTAFHKPVQPIFFQSAYAFSRGCAPDQILPRDSVISIKIRTLNNFDASHPAGSDVSDYFKVFIRNNFSPIGDYIKAYNTTLFFDDQLKEKFDLLLMTAPSLNNPHQFKIEISMSDGRLIELLSTAINLI